MSASHLISRLARKHLGEKIQDLNGEPILIGCDVVGLYPNLDPINVARITADAVRET